MLLIIFVYLLSNIMAKNTIQYIKTLPINDRSKEMVSFIGSNQKLARTLGQINFLLDCRSFNIVPQFVLNKTTLLRKDSMRKRHIVTQLDRLERTILNEEIKDAFRKKAFLQRSLTRSEHILRGNINEWNWLYNKGHQIFLDELQIVRCRLLRKLTTLLQNQSHPNINLDTSRTLLLEQRFLAASMGRCRNGAVVEHHTTKDSHISAMISAEVVSVMTASGSNAGSQPPSRNPGTRDDRHVPNNVEQPRFINLSSRSVSENLATILDKGPKYALTQNVTPATLKAVETGIERAFYGLKWQHIIAKTKKDATCGEGTPAQEDTTPPPEPDSSSEVTVSSTPAQKPMPRPYFSDSGARQPPNIEKCGEKTLEGIKSKILSVYRGTRKQEQHNHTAAQKKELTQLRQDETTIVKRSDKCKNIVIMDKVDYITKAESILSTYDTVDKNPTNKLEEDTKSLMKRTLQDKVPDDNLRRLLPQHARTAEFYGLPKTHKPGNPLRPIVSACGDPLDKLSWLLQCILTQLLTFIPAHITNTQSYLTRLKDAFPVSLPANSIIFSFDVCNLYGNIPINEAIDAVITLIESNLTKINMYSLTVDDIRTLLTHVLSNNYLTFNSKLYKQSSGIAMGNRLAPPVAIAFMHAFETKFFSKLERLPTLYMRYIDDILGVWTHGIDRLNHFFNLMNSHHSSIRFTMEHSATTNRLAFLDTLITVHPSGAYTTELYFKPMSAPIVLHYTSAHPMSTKRAVLNGEVQRALRVSSDREATDRSLNSVIQLFMQNGYPKSIVERTIKNNKYNMHATRHQLRNVTKNPTTTIYMRLPYINETIVRRVNGIIRGAKAPVKPVWMSKDSIQNRLISSALVSPPCPSGKKKCHACMNGLRGKCNTKNVIYQITCNLCEAKQLNEFYVGECTRPVRYRYNEHLSDARLRKLDTPLGEHVLKEHPDLSNTTINASFSIKILDRGKDCAEVKIKESIFIRDLKPSLNYMQSSWPLTR